MEDHIHIKIKEGAISTFSKEPSKKTLEMVNKLVEKASKMPIKDSKCKKHGVVFDYINGNKICPICSK